MTEIHHQVYANMLELVVRNNKISRFNNSTINNIPHNSEGYPMIMRAAAEIL